MTEELLDSLKACQRTRWHIIGILGTVALAAAGGIIGVLLLIRGDLSHTMGQVDVLVNLHQASTAGAVGPLVAKTNKQKGDGNGYKP
jgi:hypothetical protein